MQYFKLNDRKFNIIFSAVENDKNSDKIGFLIPKVINNINIEEGFIDPEEEYIPIDCFINWINKDFKGNTDICEKGKNQTIEGKEYLSFIWTLNETVTKIPGPIFFSLELAAVMQEEVTIFSWNTEIESFEIKKTIESNNDVQGGNISYLREFLTKYIEDHHEDFKGEKGDKGEPGPPGPSVKLGEGLAFDENGAIKLDIPYATKATIYGGNS